VLANTDLVASDATAARIIAAKLMPARWLLAWLPLACSLSAQIFQPLALPAQSSVRDDWQRVPDVMTALSVDVGSRVADVGAGSGYFTVHLSREVGSSGRVFAVDISDRALGQLHRLIQSQDLENVDVIRGEIDDPGLPERSVDAVLIVDAYHEMTEYEAILAAVYGALKPGGRLVILDLVPPDSSAARDRQTANHRLGMSVVDREIRAAGFEVIERDPRFTTSGRGSGQWMLVARRPALPRWDSNPGSLLASPRTTQTRAASGPSDTVP
jgi:predicted methyltransferase